MPTEHKGDYDIEYSGVRLIGDTDEWIANLAIFGPSTNPMHRNAVFPLQRVSPDKVFDDEKSAEEEAHKAGVEMLENSKSCGFKH
ncbi:hypothetical protein PQR62_16855 [Herbaspirillum lusitanum]|uniref:Uncharacterized protein n=1 Tax=Herbaspirillum lusitanum TaxID=213312 RepID=A0ABW9ACJ4_9BURK